MRRLGILQSEHVREANRGAVFKLLRDGKPWSRRELAEATELSFPTIAAVAQEFLNAGLIQETGQAQSGGGRPAQLLHLVPSAQTLLALDLSRSRVRAEIIDLLGRTRFEQDGLACAPGLEHELPIWLAQLLSDLGLEARRLGYLTVAVPGVIQADTGRVKLAPTLGWDDFPLANKLHDATGLPVLLENDVNAMTIAEYHHGAARQHQDLLFIALGSGIGAGLVIGGQLYRGSSSAAGEIGYSLLPGLANAPLRLGLPGPLEHHLLGLSRTFMSGGRLDLLQDGAQAAFERFADEFYIIVHNLLCLLNPKVLTLSFPADPDGKLLAALETRWCVPLPVELRPSSLGQDAALRGAAQLALAALEQRLCSQPQHALTGGLS